MKLKSLKLANSIRVGNENPAETFFIAEKGFAMEIMPGGSIIQITSLNKGSKSYTTIYNVLWFELIDEPADASKKARVKDAEAAVN